MFSTIKFFLLLIALLNLSHVSSLPMQSPELEEPDFCIHINPGEPFQAGDFFLSPDIELIERFALVVHVESELVTILPLLDSSIPYSQEYDRMRLVLPNLMTTVEKNPTSYLGDALHRLPSTEIRDRGFKLDDITLKGLLSYVKKKPFRVLDIAAEDISETKDAINDGIDEYIKGYLSPGPITVGNLVLATLTIKKKAALRTSLVVDGILMTHFRFYISKEAKHGTDLRLVPSLSELHQTLKELPKRFRRGAYDRSYNHLDKFLYKVVPASRIRIHEERCRMGSKILGPLLEYVRDNKEKFWVTDGISEHVRKLSDSDIDPDTSAHASGSGSGSNVAVQQGAAPHLPYSLSSYPTLPVHSSPGLSSINPQTASGLDGPATVPNQRNNERPGKSATASGSRPLVVGGSSSSAGPSHKRPRIVDPASPPVGPVSPSSSVPSQLPVRPLPIRFVDGMKELVDQASSKPAQVGSIILVMNEGKRNLGLVAFKYGPPLHGYLIRKLSPRPLEGYEITASIVWEETYMRTEPVWITAQGVRVVLA